MVTATNWGKIKVGNIADFQGGSQPPLSTFSSRDIPGYVRLIQIRDYKTDKYCTYVPTALAKRFCKADDIMIGRYGPPIFQILRGLEGAYNVALIKTIPKNVDKVFLYFTLKRDDLFRYIETLSRRTSGQTGIDLSNLKEFELSIPMSRQEQIAIANALSDADSLIASLQKLIAKKKAIKQGAMQELLTGKRRLPGFSGEWAKKNLEEIALILDHCRIPVKESVRQAMEGNIPYCGANGVLGFVNDYTIDDDIILVAEDGGYFEEFATRPIAYRMRGKCWVNNHAHILKAKVGIDQDYLFQALVNKDVTAYISSGTRSKLNKSELLKIEIMLPEQVTAQRAIAQVLSDMDTEIEKLEKKLSKYQKIKQGMMQELLTGKIRLIDAAPKQEQQVTIAAKKHNQQFDDAVMIAGIVNAFHSETFPLGRKKVQKLLYLMRRKEKADVSAFHKKAAGPYADSVRYNGGETIAKKNNYIAVRTNGKGTLFSRGANIGKALSYIQSWGKEASIDWLTSNFQYTRVDDLELFATVDMAICDLRKVHKPIAVQTIKEFIQSTKEWRKKLDKSYFSDPNIQRAINKCREFFGEQ